jgi:hypothetical protein
MNEPSRSSAGWLLALLLYFALRALVLSTAFDEVAMPQYELFPMGTIPLLVGVDGGLPIVRVYDNAAGQILTGLLAIPSYALFGQTYLALKLVPLVLGALALLALWASVRRLTDERAANTAALLFALAPTTLFKYSMLASGNHFETIAFTSFALWLWVRGAAQGSGLFRFGLACGFALFVFLGAITPIALLLTAHVGVRGARAALRDAPRLFAGFAAGFAPLVYVNWVTGGRALEFLGKRFAPDNAAAAASSSGWFVSAWDYLRSFLDAATLERLRQFLFEHLPEAAQFHDFGPLPGRWARWLVFAAFVVSYLSLVPGALRAVWTLLRAVFDRDPLRRSGVPLRSVVAALALAYLPLTALIFAKSTFTIQPKAPPMDAEGYRYFNTHLFLAIVVIALAAWRWSEFGRVQGRVLLSGLGRAVTAACFLAGSFNLALAQWNSPVQGQGGYYDGYKLRQVATQLISPRNGYSHEEIVAMVESYPPAYRPWLYQGLGRVLAMQRIMASKGGPLELWPILERFEPHRRADVARGFGTCFRHASRVNSGLDARFVALLEERTAAGDPLAGPAVEGLATDWEIPMGRDLQRDMLETVQLFTTLAEPLRPAYARGMGAVCGRKLRRGLAFDLELVSAAAERVPLEYARPFFEGVGAGLEEGLRRERMPPDIAPLLGPNFDPAALERGRARRASELKR